MRETCGDCNGYGLVSDYGDGQDFYGAKSCPRCGGSGTVQPRDQWGRFTQSGGGEMTKHEHWETDKSGFNVKEVGVAHTVAVLQPHARIKERASLIAAAPDMAEALEELIASSDDYDETSAADRRCIKAIETARAMLAKARGEAP